MSSQSNQTRRTRRADENAPPMTRTRSAVTTATTATTQAKALADASSRATTAKTSTKPAASSIPVMKRAASSTTVTKGTSGTASRSALGEVTNAKSKLGAKGKEVSKEGKSDKASGVERKPLASTVGTSQSQPETRRAATARNALDAKLVETVKPATKRKTTATSTTSSRPLVDRSRSNTASTSTVASTSTSRTKTGSKPLLDKAFNLKEEKEQAEPARKKRKTSSPVPPAVDDDLVDEANYDEDGTEILLSSGGRAVSLKSPKRVRAAKDEGWEDLDAEDEGDPNMVSEYVVDAFNYMMKLEATTMADPTYMDSQAELQWKMRTILMDWLIEVHSKFRLLPETLFIAINLIDRFLSARVISLVKFQLVGLTALFIAAKYEEVICPSITHFLHMTDGGYGVEEIIKAERYMLNTISFDMSYPNPLHFLRRISKADGYDIQARTVGKFLIEISAIEHKLIAYPPSLLAAASMWLARLCLERGDWTPNLIHYSGYAVEELIEPAQTMMDYLLDPELDTSSSFYKKYASKKHMKASCFMHTWATTRWPAGEEPEVAGVEAYIEAGIEPPKWRLERGSSKEL